MHASRAYLIGTHRYSYRPGEPAEIIRVVICDPKDMGLRPCYHIRFSDGEEDFVAIEDHGNYEIMGLKQMFDSNFSAAKSNEE